MKYLVCPDSFKGALSQDIASRVIENGIKYKDKEAIVKRIPLADGGEGTLNIFINNLGYQELKVETLNHQGSYIEARCAILNKTLVIEMAEICGLNLVRKRNPYISNTYGLGLAIKKVISRQEVNRIILTLGGSATNDLGLGMLKALGAKLYIDGLEVEPYMENIGLIDKIDLSLVYKTLSGIEIIGLTDVKNEVLGLNGCTYTFGRQKGIKDSDLEIIDKNLETFINRFNFKDFNYPGAGAAGGMGFCIKGILNGSLQSGIDTIMSITNFNEEIKNSDIIITGEGSFDSQSLNGKVISGIIEMVKKYKKKLIILTGRIKDIDIDELRRNNIYIYNINRYTTTYYNIRHCESNLYHKIIEII